MTILIWILLTGALYFCVNTYFKRKKGRVNFYADTIIPIIFIIIGIIPTITTFFITPGSIQVQLGTLYLCGAIALISLIFTLVKIIKIKINQQKPPV